MISKSHIKRLRRYCREPIENIRGYKEAVESEGRYECHHINELTFSQVELKKMNMYYHRPASELVIMKRSDHEALHKRRDMPSALYGEKISKSLKGKYCGENNPMYGRTGEKSPMYGKKHTDETRRKISENNGMRGRIADKSPTWKGSKVGAQGAYVRAKKLYKAGEISEEEFQPYRDAWAELHRSKMRGEA